MIGTTIVRNKAAINPTFELLVITCALASATRSPSENALPVINDKNAYALAFSETCTAFGACNDLELLNVAQLRCVSAFAGVDRLGMSPVGF